MRLLSDVTLAKASKLTKTELSVHFQEFRQNILGVNRRFETLFGTKKMIYTDWTASGRLFLPIERNLLKKFAPFVFVKTLIILTRLLNLRVE